MAPDDFIHTTIATGGNRTPADGVGGRSTVDGITCRNTPSATPCSETGLVGSDHQALVEFSCIDAIAAGVASLLYQGNRCTGTDKNAAAFTGEEGKVAAVSGDGRVLVTDTTQGVKAGKIRPTFASNGRPCRGLIDAHPVRGGVQGNVNPDPGSVVEIETLANNRDLVRGEDGGAGLRPFREPAGDATDAIG